MTKQNICRLLLASVIISACGQRTVDHSSNTDTEANRQTPIISGLKLSVGVDSRQLTSLSSFGKDPYAETATGLVADGRQVIDFSRNEMIVYISDQKKFDSWLKNHSNVVILRDSRTDPIVSPIRGDATPVRNVARPIVPYLLVRVNAPQGSGSLTHLQSLMIKRGIKGDLRINDAATVDQLDLMMSGDDLSTGWSAEPNWLMRSQSMENPDYDTDIEGLYGGSVHRTSDQWQLGSINIRSPWRAHFTGTNTTVAIIDTGFTDEKYFNPEFGGYDTTTGYNSAVRSTYSLFNFSQNTAQTFGSPGAASYHGARVADIAIGAVGNHFGGAGVAPHAKVLLMQVGWTSGGALSYYDAGNAVLSAIQYGADVINMSFGFPMLGGLGVPNTSLGDNLQQAYNNKIINVAAAGDYGDCRPKGMFTTCGGLYPVIPAAWNTVLSVGGYDESGNLYYSSYGPGAEVFAPDRNIVTAPAPDNICWNNMLYYSNYHWCVTPTADALAYYATTFNGSSAASAVMAGVASLMKQANPSITKDQILNIINTNMSKSPSDSKVTRVLDANVAVREAYKLKNGFYPY